MSPYMTLKNKNNKRMRREEIEVSEFKLELPGLPKLATNPSPCITIS